MTAVAALLAGAPNLRAASATYTGTAADNNFDTGTNWSTGTAPGDTTVGATTNADVATFGLASGAAITEATQRNLLSIVSTGGATASFTIGTTTGGAFVLSSGGLINSTSTSGTFTVNAPLVLANAAAAANGTYTFDASTPGTSRFTAIGGTITGSATSGATTLTLQGSSTVTTNAISGVISNGTGGGTLAIVKTGTGTWAINGATNTYSGGTTITSGTLRTGSSGNVSGIFGTGAITFNGGTLNLGSTTATTVNTAVVVTTGTTSFLTIRTNDTFNPTSMTGTGTLTVGNSNTANTVFTSSSFQGFGGTVDIEPNGNFTTTLRLATAFDQTSLQNATLNLGATSPLLQMNTGNVGSVSTLIGALSGAGTLGASAATSGTYTYNIGSNNASTAFSGTIINGTNATTVINKVGTGTLTLTGANSYTGLTTISAGTLNINGVNALGGGNFAGVTINGGTLQYAAGATGNGSLDVSNIGGTAKPFTVGANGATIDTNGNAVTFANTIGNNGTGALTKTGTGVLTLAAANTYTGGTNINVGTLTISTNGGLSSGNTTVAAGAILELATGVTAAHSVADSTLTLASTSSIVMLDAAMGTVQDTVLALIVAGVSQPNGTYGASGSGATTILPEFTGTGVLMVVPEPSTWALMLGGVAGLIALGSRRRGGV